MLPYIPGHWNWFWIIPVTPSTRQFEYIETANIQLVYSQSSQEEAASFPGLATLHMDARWSHLEEHSSGASSIYCVTRDLDHWVCINAEFQSDVQWYCLFLEKWNGISCLHMHTPFKDVTVATDASGSWGCGAVWSQNQFHCSSK